MITTVTNYYKYALQSGMINLGTNTVKALLMRSGFVFNKRLHRKLINLQTNTGAIALVWAALDKSVSRGSGSFITDGFVVGNQCTSNDASNPGPFTIASVTALKITFNEAVVNSSATKTLTSNDELATGNGYTQGAQTTGTISVTEDNVGDKSDATFPPITWTPSGGAIGPTTGILFYDSTAVVVIMFSQHETEVTYPLGQDADYSGGTFRDL